MKRQYTDADRSTFRIGAVFLGLLAAWLAWVTLWVPMIAATAPLLLTAGVGFLAWKLWHLGEPK